MKHRLFLSFGFLAFALSATAQNGDHKDHKVMADIVPKEMIPEAPVLSVKDAIKAFTIQEGFTIEAVVAEPLVEKPVALTFDARGRMWVCEMRGYMPDIDGKDEDKPMGRIAILEDSDGDGQVDKRTTFLDEILLPRTIALVSGGVLVGDQNQLYFVARDGDKPKGGLQVVDKHYAQGGNVEHKPNGMMTALDNWMYNAKSAFRYKWVDGKLLKEPTPFRGQWGISQDNWGRLIYNSNSTLLIGDRLQPNILTGNSLVKLKASISSRIGTNKVYPGRVTPGLNRAYISTLNGYDSDTIDPKTFKLINTTGACGPVIYRGENFPTQFQGMAFVTESAAQLVKAISVHRENGKITGSHPYKNTEFLTSTDERFRPVNLYNAPDGSLYLLDFYHGIIQHKTYMTTYLRGQVKDRGLDQPGLGHGRIYRIRAVERPLISVPNFEKFTTAQLVGTLKSNTGTHRDLAQKLLVEKADPKATELLRKLIVTKATPLTKAHALWTLEGLGALDAADITAAISTGDIALTSTALYATLSLDDVERAKTLSVITSAPDNRETLPYKSRALASIPTKEAQEALVKLLLEKGKEPFVRLAAIAGFKETAKLFKEVNNGRFSEKMFDKFLKASIKGPQKKIDPATLLKGDHLASYQRGKTLYMGVAACVGCHGADGTGLPNLGPTLDKSNWVTDGHEDLTKVLLYGLTGPIKINGKIFTSQAFMPGLAQNPMIKDQDLADIMTFIRHGWNNRAGQVFAADVTKIRKENKAREGAMMTASDFPAKQ